MAISLSGGDGTILSHQFIAINIERRLNKA